MKALQELGISQSPWRLSDDAMGGYDIRCSGVSYGDDYEGQDIIANVVYRKKDAQLMMAAPQLYDACHWFCMRCKERGFNSDCDKCKIGIALSLASSEERKD